MRRKRYALADKYIDGRVEKKISLDGSDLA